MSKKEYLAPQISVIMIEPQAILAGSGETSANAGITYDDGVESGDGDDVWEQKI